jgi:F-type H+-transporting ATPase subunit b
MLLSILAEAAGHGEGEATLLGLGPEGWVYVGITIFFVLAVFVGKAHRKILDGLDAQIAEARRTLDEAAAIRKEAEALLADAKARQQAGVKEAAALMDHARVEADAVVAKAKADTAEMIKRREKIAQDKIETAERAAIEELRNQAAGAAVAAARELIAGKHDAGADAKLVDKAIAEL